MHDPRVIALRREVAAFRASADNLGARAQALHCAMAAHQAAASDAPMASAADPSAPDILSIVERWLAVGALLEELETLRADTAEVLHHLRTRITRSTA